MTDSGKSDFLNIIIGVAIGAFIVYLLFKKSSTVSSAQPINPIPIAQDQIIQDQMVKSQQDIQQIIKAQSDIQSQMMQDLTSHFQKITHHLENTTNHIENTTNHIENTNLQLQQSNYQLQNTLSQLNNRQQQQSIQPILIESIQPIQQIRPIITEHQKQDINQVVNPVQDPIPNPIPNTVYKNNEKWEIKRGPDGRIKAVNIIRDVKKNS